MMNADNIARKPSSHRNTLRSSLMQKPVVQVGQSSAPSSISSLYTGPFVDSYHYPTDRNRTSDVCFLIMNFFYLFFLFYLIIFFKVNLKLVLELENNIEIIKMIFFNLFLNFISINEKLHLKYHKKTQKMEIKFSNNIKTKSK